MQNQENASTSTHSGRGKKRKIQHEDRGENITRTPNNCLAAHLLQIRKEMGSSVKAPRKTVRLVLAHFITRISKLDAGQDAISPTDILPPEMWTQILKYISETNDLISCSHTCRLFKTIVKERKTKKMFEMVLPLFAEYLGLKEMLKCRLICRQWDKGVCSTAEWNVPISEQHTEKVCTDLEVGNYLQQFQSYEQHIDDWFHGIYYFCLPWHFAREQASNFSNSVWPAMKLHPKSPFIGGKVLVGSLNPLIPGGPGFCTEMTHFLNDFGLHLISLIMTEQNSYQPDTYNDLCSLVANILKGCPKLRAFHMIHHTCQPKQEMDSAFGITALPDHSSIRLINVGKQECRDISSQLLTKYSNLLWILILNDWDADFLWNLPWQNLKEIICQAGLSQNIADGLKSLSAPNLTQLTISFTVGRASLKSILEVLDSFPTATSLLIRLIGGAESVPGQEEILGVPTDIICRSSITSLQLGRIKGFVCFDFLMCFPFLKTLDVGFTQENTGEGTSTGEEFFDLMVYVVKSVSTFLTAENAPKRKNRGYSFERIVYLNESLVKIFADDGKGKEVDVTMYRSNIWEIIPFLQTVSIFFGVDSECSKVFTRIGYLDSGFGGAS